MIVDWIVLFTVIPLVAGLLGVAAINRPRIARAIGITSLCSTLAMAVILLIFPVGGAGGVGGGEGGGGGGGVLVTNLGGWPAPYGITLIFDSFSGLLLATASAVALGAYIHSFTTIGPDLERRYYHPLMQLLMFGVNLSFLTGDLFNLFVAFEIMLMASYALLCLGASRLQMSQAYKYVLLNLLASTVFVMTAGMVYGMTGTLNMADLARLVRVWQATGQGQPAGFSVLAVLLLLVFGLKGAFFPLWFWLPDTYYTAPISIAGLFGGMLTKVGVYAVARTFLLIFGVGEAGAVVAPLVAIAAAFTMFLAVLGAVSQHEVRRILSIHVISQVGYMVFGIAVGLTFNETLLDTGAGKFSVAAFAMAGCVFYMIQHMVVKCALFLCCGLIEKHTGTDDLDRIGGLLRRDVLLAILFFIAAMSLVGLPPLSGFFGKMPIIRAGFADYWWLSIIGLLTGALTLLSMLKIWSYAFWSPTPQPDPVRLPPDAVRRQRSGYVGIGLLVLAALALGPGAEPVYRVALTAGDQLVHPEPYIEAVLGREKTLVMTE